MTKPKLQTLYTQIGPEKIDQLVQAFYPRVYEDPVLRPLFQYDMSIIMHKQRLFLTQFLGGPPLYSQEYGQPAMRKRHLPFPITEDHAKRWLRCMKEAFDEVGLSEGEAGEIFYERLKQVAAIMINTF